MTRSPKLSYGTSRPSGRYGPAKTRCGFVAYLDGRSRCSTPFWSTMRRIRKRSSEGSRDGTRPKTPNGESSIVWETTGTLPRRTPITSTLPWTWSTAGYPTILTGHGTSPRRGESSRRLRDIGTDRRSGWRVTRWRSMCSTMAWCRCRNGTARHNPRDRTPLSRRCSGTGRGSRRWAPIRGLRSVSWCSTSMNSSGSANG